MQGSEQYFSFWFYLKFTAHCIYSGKTITHDVAEGGLPKARGQRALHDLHDQYGYYYNRFTAISGFCSELPG